MKRIAVTGANGMTGRHMISLLYNKGIPFKAVTRKVWDLTKWKSFDELDRIFRSVLGIFHFGAHLQYNDLKNNNKQTQKIFDTNVRSCLNLGEWAKRRNVPIVFLSSATVYEDPYASKILEINARNVNKLGGFYGYSKILAEDIFNNLAKNGYGLPPEKLVQNFVNISSSGKLIKVKGSKNKINFIHAHDVANAALQAFNKKAWGVFNISSDKQNSILEVAETAISVSGSKSIIEINNEKNYVPFSRFDLNCKLAKNFFGFKTIINLSDGIRLIKNKMLQPC
jgi:nucleoside-diphosphate-sugar epimerase